MTATLSARWQVNCFGIPFLGEVFVRAGSQSQIQVSPVRRDDATPARVRAGLKHGHADAGQPAIAYEGSPPNLLQPAVLDAFIERLKLLSADMLKTHGMPLRFVGFDTFAKSFGLNEDKASESVAAHNAMEKIAETLNVAVVAVGHFGKDPTRGTRGSSAHESNAHFVLTVPKEGLLWLKKTKEAPSDIRLGRFELPIVDLGTDAKGKLVTSRAVTELGPLSGFEEIEDAEPDAPAAILLESVREGLERHGEDVTLPDGSTVRAVHRDNMRSIFVAKWITQRNVTPDAARAAFRRANVVPPVALHTIDDDEYYQIVGND
jgi:hypothetical protein